MILDYKEQMPVTHIAKKYRTSRTTVYRWIWRYETEGLNSLLDRSHKPKTPHPRSLSKSITRLIIRIRKRTKYGPRRIRLALLRRSIKVSEYAIYRTLQRNNLIIKHKNHKKRYKRVYIKEPGLDVQIDTKYLDTPPGKPYRYYQYTATDSATRMRILRIYDEKSAYYAVLFLKDIVKRFPFRVLAVRTDNGVEFTNGPFKRDHPFTLECARLDIRHILNKPAHPQSNGKCERSHRTDEEEFYRRYPAKDPKEWQYRLPKWEYEYNYQRAHQALGNITPYQAWINYKKEKERTKEKEKSLNAGVYASVT
jgi:transposase InsO family protein